ncbi:MULTISPECIES: DUF1150 family protein [unclassified Paracoccus (in: a-proteobacteria)]|uniref:DUF1150 family protein n=1 Tax=unclassified Paracoccus (in: a-proteobacteria) TaxID=2688777 RepID=UPI001603B35D|nr:MULTISPECIES: DUF1150 family protein [unclassified Paracoccus (in: a-proteobacteria)]MBB1491924.1 DUF1150 family protein [Paracoccus sp. MC1854]MBB1498213.1 DUF1150 family protein [Paracoccus sp. MC1862]QQO45704.1 DUF1150 family protein [Paracoccus sp. MC1862]
MNMKHDFPTDAGNTVYVRRVTMESLPTEVRMQAPELDALYAVHGVDGERLALVADRRLAFALARQNELVPVSVH